MTETLLILAGYVALLLWGMHMVRTGIVRGYGASLRRVLAAGMRNRFVGWLGGLGVTTLLQSSTATALLMASFAGAGLLELAPALAIMLGANVGSSLVVQFVSIGLDWLPPLLILIGGATFLWGRGSRARDIGQAGIGLGLMLLSLHLIGAASAPVRDAPLLQMILQSLGDAPVLSVLIGAALTAFTHSSLAVLLLIMSLAHHVLPLPVALALVLGANLGSGIPPVLDTLQSSPAARRVPLGNLAFRLGGVIIAVPLLPLAAALVTHMEGDAARRIADYHTLFNLGVSVLFIFFTGPTARLLQKLLPPRQAEQDPGEPRYLGEADAGIPATALASAEREALRLADAVEQMLTRSLDVFRRNDRQLREEIVHKDDVVDRLYAAIKFYLTRLDPDSLSTQEQERFDDIIGFITNLEHIGDIIEKNLMQTARTKIDKQQQFSRAGWNEIVALHEKLLRDFRHSVNAFISQDIGIARHLVEEKHEFRSLEHDASQSHIERLQHHQMESIETSALHLDILRDLKRINSHITAVAYPILERSRRAPPQETHAPRRHEESADSDHR